MHEGTKTRAYVDYEMERTADQDSGYAESDRTRAVIRGPQKQDKVVMFYERSGLTCGYSKMKRLTGLETIPPCG